MHEARSVYFWVLSRRHLTFSHSTLPYTHCPHSACLGKCYSHSVVVFTLLGIRLDGKRNAYPFHMPNMLKIDKSRANCQLNRFEHGVTALSTSTSSHRIWFEAQHACIGSLVWAHVGNADLALEMIILFFLRQIAVGYLLWLDWTSIYWSHFIRHRPLQQMAFGFYLDGRWNRWATHGVDVDEFRIRLAHHRWAGGTVKTKRKYDAPISVTKHRNDCVRTWASVGVYESWKVEEAKSCKKWENACFVFVTLCRRQDEVKPCSNTTTTKTCSAIHTRPYRKACCINFVSARLGDLIFFLLFVVVAAVFSSSSSSWPHIFHIYFD